MERGKELGQKLRKKIERSWYSIDKKQRLTPTDPHDFRQWKSAWSFSQINKLILIDRHLKPIDKAFIAFLSALDMKAHGKKITVYATNTQIMTALGIKHLSTLQRSKKRLKKRGYFELVYGGKHAPIRFYETFPVILTPRDLLDDYAVETMPLIISLQDILIDLPDSKKKKLVIDSELSKERMEEFRLFFNEWDKLKKLFHKGELELYKASEIPELAFEMYEDKKRGVVYAK